MGDGVAGGHGWRRDRKTGDGVANGHGRQRTKKDDRNDKGDDEDMDVVTTHSERPRTSILPNMLGSPQATASHTVPRHR